MSMIFGTVSRNRKRKMNFTVKNEIVFSVCNQQTWFYLFCKNVY